MWHVRVREEALANCQRLRWNACTWLTGGGLRLGSKRHLRPGNFRRIRAPGSDLDAHPVGLLGPRATSRVRVGQTIRQAGIGFGEVEDFMPCKYIESEHLPDAPDLLYQEDPACGYAISRTRCEY